MCKTKDFAVKLPVLKRISIDEIKVLSFNVENLLPKFDDPDFLTLMNEHDICLFTETWLKSDEKLRYPGFLDFSQIR